MLTAAGLFFGRALTLLGKVPFWCWPLLAALAWGGVGRLELRHLRATVATEHTKQAEAIAAEQARARAIEATWKEKFDAIKADKDVQLAATAHSRDAALAELRKRPARRTDVPGVPITTCAGATGAELANGDGEFLARYAAIARGFQLELAACQAREVTRQR